MIQLVALDLDGTLMMENDQIISPKVRRVIAAAQERGVTFTLATGRMFDFVIPVAQDLRITAPLICYQGGLIQALDSAPLYRATMQPALMREVLEWQTQRGVDIVLYAGDDVFLTERRHPDEFYRHMLGEQLVWVDDLSSVIERCEPIKFIIFVKPHEADRVRGELQQRFEDRLAVTRSHEIIVEGNPPGVSKGDALHRLAAHLGIPREQVMAVGDQDNDVPMIIWAGVGVAMGNASHAVKDVADWIAPSLAKDGAAVAIERFVLGRSREE